MIFFCEDCGSKNLLKQEHIKSGRAIFRCHDCGYSNNYLLPPRNETSRATLKKNAGQKRQSDFFLNKINDLPKVIGSFVYHLDKGVIENKMPESIGEEDLVILAMLLSENYESCNEIYPDIYDAHLFSKDKIVVLRPLREKIFMVVALKNFPFPESLMILMEKIQKKWQP